MKAVLPEKVLQLPGDGASVDRLWERGQEHEVRLSAGTLTSRGFC